MASWHQEKNIQAFLENNVQKGIVRFGYFGHMLHNWSIFHQFHSTYSRIKSKSIHYSHGHAYTYCTCALKLHVKYTHKQTFRKHSCMGSLLSCAEWTWSLTVNKWISSLKKNTDTVAYSNAHTLYYDAQRGLWALYYWTPSTKEIKGIFLANALYPVLPLPVSAYTVSIMYTHTD